MPRIIAGKMKKMTIKVPSGSITRPTADRIKENIFNILTTDVNEALFLDLFAGTGQIGLEALSRKAKCCVFVEKNYRVYMILVENIKKSRFDKYKTYKEDVISFLEKNNDKYDIIYVDPPYDSGLYEKVINIISNKDMLRFNGQILIEHAQNVVINNIYGILEKYKEYKYGSTIITILKKRDQDEKIGISW